ncbi:nuclear pore complex protein Nup155-like [Sycon ciliatum]|uniref:nuclear pore complex protein Nup155-like n=1 Tax=Sycon ciliatum TaxID=27933 RepID=UPI0020AA3A1E|eukprot:scpid51415/ scgid32250/ Nuclear pore complex protein Nup155; 155 kDa nucleoporin; Nucleoporin Nup155
MASSTSSTATAESLGNASQHVEEQLEAGRRYLDLSDLLQITSNSKTNFSGATDNDYPVASNPNLDLASLPFVGPVKRVPLPQELVDQFNHMQCSCLMGLFTDIGRAFLTIDSTIFVWNYSDGSDLAYFDGLSEVILCVALVKPKPGLFQAHIKYLLVLTTPQQIVLLGVCLNEANGLACGEMHLQPQPLFAVSSDNVQHLAVAGTPSGRILLAGKDGCLYEVVYQAQDSWFQRKCRLVNHSTSALSYLLPSFLSFNSEDALVQLTVDPTRNILYSRSEKGTVRVFDLGADGSECTCVASMPVERIVELASMYSRELDKSIFKQLVRISPIESSESSTLHLMAISSCGVRFYFTTTENGKVGRPTLLSLVHVRLPPGYGGSMLSSRPTNVHASCHREGSFLFCSPLREDIDMLWLMDADSFPFCPTLAEMQHGIEVSGRTWALESVPDETSGQLLGAGLRSEPPLILSQHVKPAPTFVLLTAQGTSIVTKLRPVDQLEQLLVDSAGSDTSALRSFFRLYQAHESCAMCLILICTAKPQVRALAEQAYLRYGGEPHYHVPPAPIPGGTAVPSPLHASTPLNFRGPATAATTAGAAAASPWLPSTIGGMVSTPPAVPNLGQSPVIGSAIPVRGAAAASAPVSSVLGRPVSGPEVVFSNRLRGLVIYFSRLIGPLWDSLLVHSAESVPGTAIPIKYCSTMGMDEINWMAQHVQRLTDFLDGNAMLASTLKMTDSSISSHGTPTDHNVHQKMLRFMRPGTTAVASTGSPAAQQQLQQKQQAEATAAEQNALRDLSTLFHRTTEVLCLWRILCENDISSIAAGLSLNHQDLLKQMKFSHLIVQGQAICSALIAQLTKRFLSDHAASEAMSARLRQLCPSLYSADDAIITQAAEALAVAKTKSDKEERQRLLEDSLKLYSKVTHHLPLSVVCSQYTEAHFFSGLVDLCLACAKKRDPQSLALHHFRQQQPWDDTAGIAAYNARRECYDSAVKCLDDLYNRTQTATVPTGSSPLKVADTAIRTAVQHYEETLSRVLASSDELMHILTYDWLIKTGQSAQLLQVTSPYLDTYLTQAAEKEPADAALGLLWKYYERTQNFAAAAQVLGQLAERRPGSQTLQQRVEYLSRAVMCAKSCNLLTTTTPSGQTLHDLEEKLEVARIQLQVQSALVLLRPSLNGDKAVKAEKALDELNRELMDISKLYGDYADQFDLSECKLAIVHCAGHHDPALVEALWREIVDQELEQSASASADARAQSLSNKLVSLGQLYCQSQRYFPVAFLVRHLEELTARLRLPLGWVATAFQQVGITASVLLNVYERLFKAKDPCWQSAGRPLHVLNAIHMLLASPHLFANLLPTERASLRLNCLQTVTGYLVELQSMISQDSELARTVADFKKLQAKFQA